jgi:hypothetical protein
MQEEESLDRKPIRSTTTHPSNGEGFSDLGHGDGCSRISSKDQHLQRYDIGLSNTACRWGAEPSTVWTRSNLASWFSHQLPRYLCSICNKFWLPAYLCQKLQAHQKLLWQITCYSSKQTVQVTPYQYVQHEREGIHPGDIQLCQSYLPSRTKTTTIYLRQNQQAHKHYPINQVQSASSSLNGNL